MKTAAATRRFVSQVDLSAAESEADTATHCNNAAMTLQHTARRRRWIYLQHTLQHTATKCNTLQHAVTRCNTLQHTVAHCNTLQHVQGSFTMGSVGLFYNGP